MSFVLNSKLQARLYITLKVFNCLLFANSIFTFGYNKFRMICSQFAVYVSNKLVGDIHPNGGLTLTRTTCHALTPYNKTTLAVVLAT